jgi:hypothetical protein
VVPEVNPVKLLVNEVTVPSLVMEFAIVGLVAVLQQIPTAVRATPPVDVTSPPDVAVDELIDDMVVVITDDATPGVVKLSSFP